MTETQDPIPTKLRITTRYSWRCQIRTKTQYPIPPAPTSDTESKPDAPDVTETRDPIPPTTPPDAESKEDAPKGKVWVKTESGMPVLLTEKAVAKQSGSVPDSIIRKGSIVKSSDTDGKTEIQVPKKGRMNFGMLVLIAVLWGHRVTLEGASEFIKWLCGIKYSPTTIMNALTRMGNGFKPFTADILAQLHKAPTVYIDETTFRVGKKRMRSGPLTIHAHSVVSLQRFYAQARLWT